MNCHSNLKIIEKETYQGMDGWTCTCIPLPIQPYFKDGIRRLIAGDGSGLIRIVNSKTHTIESELRHLGSVFHILYYKTNKILVTDSLAQICVVEFYPKLVLIEMRQIIQTASFGFVQLLKCRKLWKTYYATCVGFAFNIEEVIRNSQQISVVNMKERTSHVSFLNDPIYGHQEGVFNIKRFRTKIELLVSCGGGHKSHVEGSKDFSLRVWNWKTRKLVRRFKRVHTDGVRALDTFLFKTKDEMILSSGFDGKVIIWTERGQVRTVLESGVKEGFYTCRLISNSWDIPVPQYLLGSMNGGVYSFRIPASQEGVVSALEKRCSPFVDYVYAINFVNNVKTRKIRRLRGKSKELFICVSGDGNWKLFEMKNLCTLDSDLRERIIFLMSDDPDLGIKKLSTKIGWSLEFWFPQLLVEL